MFFYDYARLYKSLWLCVCVWCFCQLIAALSSRASYEMTIQCQMYAIVWYCLRKMTKSPFKYFIFCCCCMFEARFVFAFFAILLLSFSLLKFSVLSFSIVASYKCMSLQLKINACCCLQFICCSTWLSALNTFIGNMDTDFCGGIFSTHCIVEVTQCALAKVLCANITSNLDGFLKFRSSSTKNWSEVGRLTPILFTNN